MLNYIEDDILGHIFTFLDIQDRVNTNEILLHKVIRKFPIKYAFNHHVNVIVSKWKNMLFTIESLRDSQDKRLRKIYRLIQDFRRPVNMVVAKKSKAFALTVCEKMDEFILQSDSSPLQKMIKRLAIKCLEEYKKNVSMGVQ
jgi:hypothetical protein